MNAILPETHLIGANNPPEPTAREAISTHIADLLVEAHAWADGTLVESQAQADEASRLIEDLRKAAKAGDDQRVAEKKPFDDGAAEVQTYWGTWIADPKTKNPGRVWKAIDALKASVKPFLEKLEAERVAAARKAHEEAQAAAQRAADAARAAQASDLSAQEAADDLIRDAEQAAAAAKRIENSRTQARGGTRAMGLTKTYTAQIDNPRDALLHYWGGAVAGRGRDALIATLQQLAQQDVNAKIHTIPGVTVIEGTRL